jgi:hypothetical protein
VSLKRELSDSSSYSSSNESVYNVFNIDKQIKHKVHNLEISAKQEELKIEKIKKVEKKKYKHDSKRNKPKYEKNVENIYFEDKHRNKEYNNMNTISSRIKLFYDVSRKTIGFTKCKQSEKDIFHRYYIKNIDSVETSKKKDTIIKKINKKEIVKEETNENYSWCKNIDEEQKCKTREYNKQLMENPFNIDLWLQYIDFQVLNEIFFFCIFKFFNHNILLNILCRYIIISKC